MLNISEFRSRLDAAGGIAKPNKFMLELPMNINGGDFDIDVKQSLNVFCQTVNLPGKQIATTPREIGIKYEKMVNGYEVDDISISFLLTNDFTAKRYFETWAASAINYSNQKINYKTDYERDVIIHQLDQQGKTNYKCKLKEAFPTTLNPIEMADQANDTFVQYNVQLSYTDWEEIKI
tara:strand:+ start:1303 stop:1836 length:534 start_codon:yes stop_codon:yes gene_type:complete